MLPAKVFAQAQPLSRYWLFSIAMPEIHPVMDRSTAGTVSVPEFPMSPLPRPNGDMPCTYIGWPPYCCVTEWGIGIEKRKCEPVEWQSVERLGSLAILAVPENANVPPPPAGPPTYTCTSILPAYVI